MRFISPIVAASLVLSASRLIAADPNVVLIVIDDLGWADLSCYGSQLHKTPQIDKRAAGGVRFTQA
jgi:arylsulfatase A